MRGDDERRRKEQGLEIDQETEHAMARCRRVLRKGCWVSLQASSPSMLTATLHVSVVFEGDCAEDARQRI